MNRICYIDEDEKDIFPFVTRMESKGFKVDYIKINDGLKLSDLLDELTNHRFDCLVVDYYLNMQAHVSFQGDEVVAAYQTKFPEFPVLMLSNKDDGAIEESENINVEIIRSKDEYVKNENLFVTRLDKMIEVYRQKRKQASDKLVALKKKEIETRLTANEEDDLIKLDTFLDDTLDASNKLSMMAKKSSNAKRLDDLISRADTIIEKLDKL